MANWSYPTSYTDKWGTELTTIHNDGSELTLNLRGVRFSGRDFDALSPDGDGPNPASQKFSFLHGSLCECSFDIEMSVPVLVSHKETIGELLIRLELGTETLRGRMNREVLKLTLHVQGQVFCSEGVSSWFEDELLSLRQKLPEQVLLKCCFHCAYSDYSPYGHGLFGGMACFRNFKREYSAVKGKDALFRILDKADVVQETFLCEDFKVREPNTGYRG